jgi:Pre-mRNA 3'-end-processing endonuclease polyadenylation factor C-term
VPLYRLTAPSVPAVEGAPELRIAEQVTLTHVPPGSSDAVGDHGQVVLEWESSPAADCTADAVVAVLLQAQGPPAAIGAAEAERKCAACAAPAAMQLLHHCSAGICHLQTRLTNMCTVWFLFWHSHAVRTCAHATISSGCATPQGNAARATAARHAGARS